MCILHLQDTHYFIYNFRNTLSLFQTPNLVRESVSAKKLDTETGTRIGVCNKLDTETGTRIGVCKKLDTETGTGIGVCKKLDTETENRIGV